MEWLVFILLTLLALALFWRLPGVSAALRWAFFAFLAHHCGRCLAMEQRMGCQIQGRIKSFTRNFLPKGDLMVM